MIQHHCESRWLTMLPDISLRARLAAVVEPVVIILGATLLARLILRGSGVPDADDFLFRDGTDPDFLSAAVAEGRWHALRYGLILCLAIAVGWWRGRRTPRSYGITLGTRSLFSLMGIGIVLGLVASLPLQLLHIVHEHVPLGSDTPFWELRDRVTWGAEFWIYMAVGSFLIVPLVEEVVARGYVLGRLRESYSPGAALVLIAIFFALAHGQYHRLEILAVGQLASLALLSVVFGYALYRTGSLIPAIVAHAIINVPLNLTGRYLALVATVSMVLVFRNDVTIWSRALVRLFADARDWVSTLPAIGLIATALLTLGAAPWVPYAWLCFFLLALVVRLKVRSTWSESGALRAN